MDINSNTLLAVYDLSVCPATFDFVSFVSMAKIHQEKIGAISLTLLVLPGTEGGFRHGDSALHNWPAWRYRHILGEIAFACASEANLIFLVDRERGRSIFDTHSFIFPEGCCIDNPIGYYDLAAHKEVVEEVGVDHDSVWLEASPEGCALARRYFSDIAGAEKKIVLITLRSCSYQKDRNSDIDAWIEFAGRLDRSVYEPIFIPDSDDALCSVGKLGAFEVCVAASFNFELRTGMYSEAYINLVVNNGPVLACLKQQETRYLYFKPTVVGNPSSGLHAYRSADWLPGGHWPGASELQCYVWAEDSVETISMAFGELVNRIEGGMSSSGDVLGKCAAALDCGDVDLALGSSAVAISFHGEEVESWRFRLESLLLAGQFEELVDSLGEPVIRELDWVRSKKLLLELVLVCRSMKRWRLYRDWACLLLELDGSYCDNLASRLGREKQELLMMMSNDASLEPSSRVLIFGCGEAGLRAANDFDEERGQLIGFLDNDSSKHGSVVKEVHVYSPVEIERLWPCRILIASMYHLEIKEQLLEVGVPHDSIDLYLA